MIILLWYNRFVSPFDLIYERGFQMEENVKKHITRPAAREYAFALLFARTFSADEPADDFYARELENAEIDFGVQLDYVHDVFFGVCDRQEEINGLISKYAAGWTVSRLARTSAAILRLSVYEMMAVSDVPKRVSINEAVELAKKYDDDKAPAYINGVLNSISKALPDKECDAESDK